jgi:hypothetical protein
VSMEGDNSVLFDLFLRTVQGSTLGLWLYSSITSTIFEIKEQSVSADDSVKLQWNTNIIELICDIEKYLELITKWLRWSGRKDNENKTKLCLFSRLNVAPVVFRLGNIDIVLKVSMVVLGEVFDSKFDLSECQWMWRKPTEVWMPLNW